MNKSKIIERLELELLSTLFKYVIPFIDKTKKSAKKVQNQKTSNLENIINTKPKISFNDVKELESLILKNLSENVKINKNAEIKSNKVFYSLSLRRQKAGNEGQSKYSISIKYEENQSEDKLKISIKDTEKELYSAEIVDKKDPKDRVAPYSITINYENRYDEERLTITYKQQLKNYIQKHIDEKENMSNRVPLKWLNILPETSMGGVLGFTYIGDPSMGRRADLTGKTARMVDIHESIHTPDEYETRVLTSWIMEKAKGKYVK